jgi:hypothetical protein
MREVGDGLGEIIKFLIRTIQPAHNNDIDTTT